EMPGLDVIGREPQVEPALTPLVPDRREQNRTVGPQGREYGDERLVQEVAHVVEGQVRAHDSRYPARRGPAIHYLRRQRVARLTRHLLGLVCHPNPKEEACDDASPSPAPPSL